MNPHWISDVVDDSTMLKLSKINQGNEICINSIDMIFAYLYKFHVTVVAVFVPIFNQLKG